MFLLKQSSQLTSCFGVDCINVLNSSETSFSFSIRRASLSSGSSFSLLSCVSFLTLFNFSHLVISCGTFVTTTAATSSPQPIPSRQPNDIYGHKFASHAEVRDIHRQRWQEEKYSDVRWGRGSTNHMLLCVNHFCMQMFTDNYIFELQFHTPGSFKLKTDDSHLFYEALRNDEIKA